LAFESISLKQFCTCYLKESIEEGLGIANYSLLWLLKEFMDNVFTMIEHSLLQAELG
jgi:hypothetical protein